LDEVGRGALAGPLVAAAIILPEDIRARLGPLARFLRDSKTVPPLRRTEVATELRRHALALAVVEIPVEEIDAHGIGWSNKEAFFRLIDAVEADEYVVDGHLHPPAPPDRAARVRCQIKADSCVPAVSAASLVAKAYRDASMARLHESYPAYGWASNAGYGTPAHLSALRAYGSTIHHRAAFVATALGSKSRLAKTPQIQRLL
jgi:ribonuclease HII